MNGTPHDASFEEDGIRKNTIIMAKDFLGKGWSFPPTFSKAKRGVQMVEDADNVAKSIKVIVMTRLGERMFHPSLGTNISDLLFSRNINSSTRRKLETMIEYAIVENEARVDVDGVNVENNRSNNSLDVTISYTIKSTNNKYNMVFPFYLESGVKL